MANFPHKRYYQTATHWTITQDRFGGYTFSAPTTFICRWEDKTDEFMDANGRQAISRAFVYTERELELEDYLYLGSTAAADPETVTPKHKVAQVRRRDLIPSVDGLKTHKKYYLV